MVTPPRHPVTESSVPAEEPTDAELIARSLADPQAFMPLLERHHRVLFGYLARRVGRDIAEDVTSETFARAFEHRNRYDSARPDARPWLFGIATNLIRNHARSEVRQLRAYTRHGVDDRTNADDDAIAARVDAEVASPRLAAALLELKPGDRDALAMFAWNDMSYEEIAAALEIPVGTVRSRLNRARRIVQEHLAEDAPADSDDDGNATNGTEVRHGHV
jgi:RNA polymerase sigma-70 factor (ECF subfamily)